MEKLTEGNITEAAVARFGAIANPRFRQIMASLLRHLHGFAREVALTPEEWRAGIDFLTAVGHITDDRRQEFILLSDTLGLSALVDLVANRGRDRAATASSLLGPFYRQGAPELPLGADIARGIEGQRVVLRGSVKSIDGRPLAGAILDVWQAAPSGLYDLQMPEERGMNLRGRFRADTEGRFRFRSVKPASYPVPFDGPVGKMLAALGRHPYRPAHIHFIVTAPEHEPLTTALYIEGDRYLESDAVFGSRDSLVVGYRRGAGAAGDDAALDSIEFDFVLSPKRGLASSRSE
jgi:hydroxyquinol 1,2-dioxygenase